ncbi:iron ABC transporter permease [Sporosarcina sp. FSL K6-1522]|uniref:FecCD family ABC transporter permease n=1 Tax=Sporosarcina sp. FSL K6-1522 TaxID=2921554 RepID=UPI003159BAB2
MMIHTTKGKWIALILSSFVLIICLLSSIVFGYTETSWSTAFAAFKENDGSTAHLVILNVRLPRALIAAIVGACLATSGAIMQSITKNPLASPSILGINAGAVFFVVIGVVLFQLQSLQSYMIFGLVGAAVSFIIVFLLSSIGREGLTPMKLILAGAAVSALFSSMTQGFLTINEAALDQVLFWMAGSVANRPIELLNIGFPYMVIGLLAAFLLSKQMNLLALGDDIASGLGQNVILIKFIFSFIVVVLAGTSVAIAGPISFIGIIIPHIVRSFVGIQHQWVFPFSAIYGGILLLLADIATRYIMMPKEVPVGAMTALIGVPFFIYVARRRFAA